MQRCLFPLNVYLYQSNCREIPRYSLLANIGILSRRGRERVWKACKWTLTVHGMTLLRVQNKMGLPAEAGVWSLE